MANSRVKMLRADRGEAQKRIEVLEARLRAVGNGTEMTLNLDEVEMVREWYSWAADEGVRSAFSSEGRALVAKLDAVIDIQAEDEVE